jgi:hypothetical protein
VLIDLDETLYLRNSTEDFIDCARPALVALLLMRMLDVIRPWRWSGGDRTRDVWRVRCILLFFPWTRSVWAKRVASLAASAANVPLIAALNNRSLAMGYEAPVIVTLGFEDIVGPLVAALDVPQSPQVIATRHSVFADRLAGKVKLIAAKLGPGIIERSLVITDSQQDAELLQACAVPLRTIWPRARFRPAHSGVYLPGQYITQVKRRGERHFVRGVLQEDFALWVLASLTFTQPVLHVVGLLFLVLSFWAIYESGYVDNDNIAARFERDPALSDAYFEAPVATPRWAPWGWAIVSGGIGTLILRGHDLRGAYAFGAWIAVLLATHGVFLTYNRSDKMTRIWLYGALQLARGAAFIAVVSVSVIGALAVGAHVLARWVPYYMYRQGSKGWPPGAHLLPRLLFFVLLSLVVSFATGYSLLLSWSAAALLAWNVFRARRELREAVRAAAPSSEAHARTFY